MYGAYRCVRRRETAALAGAAAVVAVYVAARAGGTPYTAAKALEIAAPVLTLLILLPLAVSPGAWRISAHMTPKGANGPPGRWILPVAAGLYVLAAGSCSLLAFANTPVGPTSYSPALTGLRPLIADQPAIVLAPRQLLEQEQGTRYIAWELRGGRVCIALADEADHTPPAGVRYVVSWAAEPRPPYTGMTVLKNARPYRLWRLRRITPGETPCPLIAVRQARHGPQP
jgi:hypothetical protein